MLDVAIIGCGVVGAAAAYELSHYPLHVAVLEAENDVADGTTKANSAILHAGYDPEPGTQMARLNVQGVALAKEICARLDVPYRQCGSLVLALSQAKISIQYENGGFHVIDQNGARLLYRYDSSNAAERLFLKLLFPSEPPREAAH